MRRRTVRAWAVTGLAIALLGAAGCPIGADLVNRGLLTSLGLDPDTIVKPTGSVLVAFVNNTNFAASFTAYQTDDPNDLSLGTRTFSADVDPRGNANEVLRCPTGSISLGLVDAAFVVTPTGAVVFGGGGTGGTATPVTYDATPLVEGRDYSCGDVIEFTLSAVTTGQTSTFEIGARVIPGR